MFKWYRELLEIRQEARERKASLLKQQTQCESCETLKHQLEVSNFEKKQLLDRLLEKPAPEVIKEPVPITRPHNIPWNVRRQILEQEDREKARLLREAAKPISTEDLEKELDNAATERENKTQG